MNEKELTQIAKQYLKKQGYEITSLMSIYDEKEAKIFGVDLSNRDYAVYRLKQGASTPDIIQLFVKDNSLEKQSAGAYPDIIAIKNGKPYMFEVKATLENEHFDRCIGQCLRYLDCFPIFKEIIVLVPEGVADLKGIMTFIEKFGLPIRLLELPTATLSQDSRRSKLTVQTVQKGTVLDKRG